MELGWDRDVELHEGGYWSVGLCAGVGGNVGGGIGVNVDGADGVSCGGGVGDAVGDGCGDSGTNVGGSWLCGVVFESSGGGFVVVVVVLEDFE